MVQVRTYLHVVLCFSPVGERFRVRARQFPALVNCTTMDWFHTWTSEVCRIPPILPGLSGPDSCPWLG